MIKEKYTYKEFVQVYISFRKCYKDKTQEREYYSMLYTFLSEYFGIDLAVISFEDSLETVFEGRNMNNEGIALIKPLIKEYNSIKDIFNDRPLYVTGLPEDLHRRFNPNYSKSTEARKKLLLKMIIWLCREVFGSNKKYITHEKLRTVYEQVIEYEMKLNPVLDRLYHKSKFKNVDNWSVSFSKEDLAKSGYTCALPELKQTIKIGTYQIKGVWLDGIAFSLRPIT